MDEVSRANAVSWNKLLASRHYSLGHSDRVETYVRGVSFEGRQAIVSQLVPAQGVVVMADVMNEYDGFAQAVHTADMTLIGYVPKELAPSFPYKVCFGKVVSAGMAQEGGFLGTKVALSYKAHGLWLDLLPDSWEKATDLEQILGEERCREVEAEVLRASRNRCAVTDMKGGCVPLHVVPQWAFDYKRHRVYLVGLLPVCEPVLQLKQQLAEAGEQLLASEAVLSALVQHAEALSVLKTALDANEQRRRADPDIVYWDQGACALAEAADVTRAAALAVIETVASELPAQQLQAIQRLATLMAWPHEDALLYLLHAVLRCQQLEEGWELRQPSWDQVQQLLRPVERDLVLV